MLILVSWVLALVFGLLPPRIPKCRDNAKLLGLMNAFSGGLFLAIALVHILPDVQNEYVAWAKENSASDSHEEIGADEASSESEKEPFPLPFILVFVGYALILLIDRVIFDSHSLFDSHGHSHGGPS